MQADGGAFVEQVGCRFHGNYGTRTQCQKYLKVGDSSVSPTVLDILVAQVGLHRRHAMPLACE